MGRRFKWAILGEMEGTQEQAEGYEIAWRYKASRNGWAIYGLPPNIQVSPTGLMTLRHYLLAFGLRWPKRHKRNWGKTILIGLGLAMILIFGIESALAQEPIHTLHTIEVVEKRLVFMDEISYQRNFNPNANVFNKYWNDDPSLEQIAIQGGLVQKWVGQSIEKSVDGVTSRLPGYKGQIIHATARPSPLSKEQLARADRYTAK